MTARHWMLYGLVALITGVLNLPAAWVGYVLEQTSHANLQVQDSQGTVWKGQLNLSVNTPPRPVAIPDPIKWQVHLWSNNAWLDVEITHTQLSKPVIIRWSGQQWAIDAGSLHTPAAWLTALGAPFNTIRPEGVLHLDWKSWEAGRSVGLELIWQDAQTALSSIRPLGEYAIAISGIPSEQLKVKLNTVKGPLILEGQGTLAPHQRLVFSGYASAQPQDQDALRGLLSQLGKREGSRYRLTLF